MNPCKIEVKLKLSNTRLIYGELEELKFSGKIELELEKIREIHSGK